MSKIKAYFRAQNIEFSVRRIFIDGLGGMAYGLFASLLIGTIISTVGAYLFDLRFRLWGNEYSLFADANGFAKAVQIGSYLSAEKDAGVAADAEKPDLVVSDIRDIVPWLDEINPEMALK